MKTTSLVVLSVLGGILGAYLFTNPPTRLFGATVARTTITNPWTFASTTIFNAKGTVTTTNTATSTLIVGCLQTYATSTASPIKFQASTTPGIMYSQFGS